MRNHVSFWGPRQPLTKCTLGHSAVPLMFGLNDKLDKPPGNVRGRRAPRGTP